MGKGDAKAVWCMLNLAPNQFQPHVEDGFTHVYDNYLETFGNIYREKILQDRKNMKKTPGI